MILRLTSRKDAVSVKHKVLSFQEDGQKRIKFTPLRLQHFTILPFFKGF